MLASTISPVRILGVAVVSLALAAPVTFAQDRDHEYDRDRHVSRIEPGTRIDVRTTEPIHVDRDEAGNNRVYHAVVEHDVIGEHDRVAIPRGANVDLRVRVAPDNDLILDLDSVWVNGQRYGIESNPDRIESQKGNDVVGSIIGALGGEVRGRAVRVERDTELHFRIERPLIIHEGEHRDYDGDRR